MIKGDVKIPEPAMNLPPTQLRKNVETNLLTATIGMENRIVEKSINQLEVKNHFSRLKRRMRRRSTNIF